jgi:membrane-associated phospholipid phosphatase
MACALTGLPSIAHAQLQHNAFTTPQTWIATSGSFVLAGGSFLLQQQVKPLSLEQITTFEQRSFSGIAAYPTNRFDRGAARTSDVITLATAVLPATLLLFKAGRNEVDRGLHMYMQTAFLNFAVTNFTKSAVLRNRPYVYNPNAPMHLKHDRDARLSFFSGHTSTSASFCFFTASMVQAYSSNRTVKTLTWIGAAVVPAVTGYLRMRAGKHFFSDVLVGYAAGAAIGLGVPLAHRKRTAIAR